mgnify:CR=1 FL=1
METSEQINELVGFNLIEWEKGILTVTSKRSQSSSAEMPSFNLIEWEKGILTICQGVRWNMPYNDGFNLIEWEKGILTASTPESGFSDSGKFQSHRVRKGDLNL